MTAKSTKALTGGANAQMTMSAEARARTRATEKAVYRYYNDLGERKGNCSWGVGILAHKGLCTEEELVRTVSVQAVDQEFARRISEAENIVRKSITVSLNQAQFDALCSLTYNAGQRGAKDTFHYVNQGNFAGAAANISKMIKVGIMTGGKKKYVVVPGLIKRRAEESAPFRGSAAAVASE